MTTTVQVSGKYAETIVLVKAEADEPTVAFTDFGAILGEFGQNVATNVHRMFTHALTVDPLAAAAAVVQTAVPGTTVQQPPAPEPWGNPPVPPMQVPAAAGYPAQQPYQPPQAAPQAPAAGAPQCQHGVKQFKTGVSAKTNKAWKAWMCPAPKGDPTQCQAEWVRD